MNLQILLPLTPLAGALIGWLTGRHAGYDLTLLTIVGFVIGIGPLFLLLVSGGVLSAWSPDQPDCLCSWCRSEDYVYDGMECKENGKPCAYRYHCPKCGRHYVSRESPFLEVRGGDETPYRKLNPWGRWSS